MPIIVVLVLALLVSSCSATLQSGLNDEVRLDPSKTYVLVESLNGDAPFIPGFCDVPPDVAYQPAFLVDDKPKCYRKADKRTEKIAAFLSTPLTEPFPSFKLVTFDKPLRSKAGSIRLESSDKNRGVFFLKEVEAGHYFPALGGSASPSGAPPGIRSVTGAVPYFDIREGQINYLGVFATSPFAENHRIQLRSDGLKVALKRSGLRDFENNLHIGRPKKGVVTCLGKLPAFRSLDTCRMTLTDDHY